MSTDACVFSSLNLSFQCAQSIQIPCNGQLEKLREMTGVVQTFGCEHSVDLLLIRGGIVIDWTNEAESSRIFEMFVCSNHKINLLSSWNWNKFGNKRNNQGKITCSLGEIIHERRAKQLSVRRLNKVETLKLIEATGRFFHVGTGVCDQHSKAISHQKFESLAFPAKVVVRQDSAEDELLQLSDVEFSDIDSSSPYDEDFVFDGRSIDSLSLHEPTPDRTVTTEEEKQGALRNVASLFGLSRLTSGMEWSSMQPDTKRKKVSSMLRLQEELYKLCAGSEWESMRNDCVRKTGQVVDCSRVTSILQSIDERLEQTTDRRSRLSLVSIIAGHFSEKEITHATGVSRYFIREAKKYAVYGLEEVSSIRRANFNFSNLKLFIEFISRPEILVWLPKPARSFALSSGDSLTIARVARLHSYRQIFNMFQKFLEGRATKECAVNGGDLKEFMKKNSFCFTTCYKIMEVLLPARRTRMLCVDNFQSDAIESFNSSLANVTELKEKGLISDSEAHDLLRRLRVAQNYLTGYFRMHLSMSSPCSSHCIRFALSDRSSRNFQSSCDHAHEDSCDQCTDILSVFDQFKEFLAQKANEAHANLDCYRFRLSRMIEETEEAEKNVKEYQRHIVRAALSEMDRVTAINNLTDGWALVTMDFSLKLMPSGFVESQSQWFGKAGISFHVSHVLISKGGANFHHTLGHLNDDAKQDSFAILAIADHVFSVLAENGVCNVVLRSDNAGNYRNAGVIYTLSLIAQKYGITLVGYLFSEAQSGKGAADRQISHAKRKIINVVDSGGYGRDAAEILKTLTTDPLLKAYSFYIIQGGPGTKEHCSIDGIGNLSSFRYEDEGIRVRRFDCIGDGIVIPFEKLEEVKFKYQLLGNGGHLSKSDGFWGELSDKPSKGEGKSVVQVEKDDEDNEKAFRCTERTCNAKYLTLRGLENHLLIGKHREKKYSDTITEAAAKLFSASVETNESAYLSMKVDFLSSSHSNARSLALKEGWAIRVKNKTSAINPAVRREVKQYFIERRTEGKRAEARWVVQMLRNKTNPDGSYSFVPLTICLKESQAQSLIGRFLKVESKKGLKRLESDQEDEEQSDNEMIFDLESEPAKKKRGRPSKSVQPNKKTTRKASKSVGKKANANSQQNVSPDESEGDPEESNLSTGVEETKPSKPRGRPSKKSVNEESIVAKNRSGRKTIDDEREDVPPQRRVLRSQKRGVTEVKKIYYEPSSDDEIDDFTHMMNTVLDPDNFKQIFTDV